MVRQLTPVAGGFPDWRGRHPVFRVGAVASNTYLWARVDARGAVIVSKGSIRFGCANVG